MPMDFSVQWLANFFRLRLDAECLISLYLQEISCYCQSEIVNVYRQNHEQRSQMLGPLNHCTSHLQNMLPALPLEG